VGALFLADIAHVAGLIAAGVSPNPVPIADLTTTTTHKTLRGPRGGMILAPAPSALTARVAAAVYPGLQGGPLEHVIAAKAVTFKLATGEAFRDRQERTLLGAQLLADRLLTPDARMAGVSVVSGGTDVHLVLADLRASQLDGKQAEDRLHQVGITVNRNAVPFDPRPPMVSSGLRIGTPALATRGFDAAAFDEVADVIAQALSGPLEADALDGLRGRVEALASKFPLYPLLED
jgi:glycine hydroxymethyltransferase